MKLDRHEIEWTTLPDGAEALLVDGGGIDGGEGAFIANAGDDLHVVGSLMPLAPGQIAQELEQRGIRVSAFPQHDSRMVPASQRLHDAITERRLVHPDDPRLNQHVAAAVARHGRRGWRIDKANRADKIDAVVALCMALDRIENRPEPTRLVGWL